MTYKELMLTGKVSTAKEALEISIASKAVLGDKLDDEVEYLA